MSELTTEPSSDNRGVAGRARARAISRIVTIALAAVVVWGVVAGIVQREPGDRLYEVTSRIRCPLCQGESVAESPSASAQDITNQIRQQIEAGWTDRQIEQFYVERYGSWVLLDPPRTGSHLVLWAIPLVAITGGVIAVISLLEPSKRRTRLTYASGALGAATLGTMIVLGVALQDPPPEAAPPLTTVAETRDLAEVGNDEMEVVVAENPTVVGMRLALAQRYLEAGELDDAYRHTTIAIDLPATDQEYERSLRLHGWVTALRGAPESGKVSIVNFWAPWCVPCRREHRDLGTLRAGWDGSQVRLVGVAFQSDLAAIGTFLDEIGEGVPTVIDDNGVAAIEFGVVGVPETFVIDRAGIVRRRFVGPIDPAELQRMIDELLLEGPAA